MMGRVPTLQVNLLCRHSAGIVVHRELHGMPAALFANGRCQQRRTQGGASLRLRVSNRLIIVRCAPTAKSSLLQPAVSEASAWAPATVANLGPGFDWMGCAVDVRFPHASCLLLRPCCR
jgi:hypothetical protein